MKGQTNTGTAVRDELRQVVYRLNQELRALERFMERRGWAKLFWKTTYNDLADARIRLDTVMRLVEQVVLPQLESKLPQLESKPDDTVGTSNPAAEAPYGRHYRS